MRVHISGSESELHHGGVLEDAGARLLKISLEDRPYPLHPKPSTVGVPASGCRVQDFGCMGVDHGGVLEHAGDGAAPEELVGALHHAVAHLQHLSSLG
jgi:hypothetical protein